MEKTLETSFIFLILSLTDSPALVKRSEHFWECPPKYKDYCIRGKCKFVEAVKVPSCICEMGYVGSRCELIDILYLTSERRHIVAISLVAAFVGLVILIIFICLCVHHWRKKHRQPEKSEEAETLEIRPAENNNIAAGNQDTIV
ncbi:probetacellulin-like isoform X2 [Protopterus annectens]|uniref:probetacellulin-like isoform X2 n=1 Tax=Protopterus annectens TaxID=7888 RepID=UPI001CFA58D0|nr:probetacellulin-like isoform X2 [Protopterus annectens]